MNPQPYLLFDAGGTLVFPDEVYLAKLAERLGVHLEHKKLYSGYYRVIHSLDTTARGQGWRFPDDPWPDGYPWALFQQLDMRGVDARVAAASAHTRHQKKANLWTYTFPWVRDTLDHLRAMGYRMSVLSNSDGRTDRVFRALGLRGYFQFIFDSEDLKIRKPDPEIFHLATKRLGRSPGQVLYIGDIYTVDVLGAQNAGLQAIHVDPLGLYNQGLFPGERLRDIRGLPAWLERRAATREQTSEDRTIAEQAPAPAVAQA